MSVQQDEVGGRLDVDNDERALRCVERAARDFGGVGGDGDIAKRG